jgi:hypothetical protein
MILSVELPRSIFVGLSAGSLFMLVAACAKLFASRVSQPFR